MDFHSPRLPMRQGGASPPQAAPPRWFVHCNGLPANTTARFFMHLPYFAQDAVTIGSETATTTRAATSAAHLRFFGFSLRTAWMRIEVKPGSAGYA